MIQFGVRYRYVLMHQDFYSFAGAQDVGELYVHLKGLKEELGEVPPTWTALDMPMWTGLAPKVFLLLF